MRIFDENKINEIFQYDEKEGFLREDKLFVAHHPATHYSKEIGHYKTVRTYPNGGTDVEWVVDVEGTEEKEAWDEYEEILVYVPFTAEQLQERRIAKIKERLSQLSEDFVQSWAGAQIADIDARKREFADLHNELRGLLGKAPRVYY